MDELENRHQAALSAILDMYNYSGVTKSQTLDKLNVLLNDIEILASTLQAEIESEELNDQD